MEAIMKNPGLQYITDNILMALDGESLKKCQKLNLLGQFINQPRFLLKFWLKELSQEEFFKDHIKSFKELICKFDDNEDDLKMAMADQLEEMCKYSKNRTNSNSQFFNKNSGSPLYLAIALIKAKENLPLVEFILENIDPTHFVEFTDEEFKNQSWKLTPVHISALFGLTEIVQKLTQNLENPNISNDDAITPMQLAARNGNIGTVQFLLNSTVQDVHIPNVYGYAPIHYATEMGHTEVVYELAMDLVTKTQNPNPPNTIDSNTPLHYAAIKGDSEIIKFLIPLTNGNLNIANNQGLTPAILAFRNDYTFLGVYLLQNLHHTRTLRLICFCLSIFLPCLVFCFNIVVGVAQGYDNYSIGHCIIILKILLIASKRIIPYIL